MKVLRQRNFAVLYYGQMLSTIGNHLFTLALLWYVLTTTGSRLDVSLAGFAQALPGVAALFTGVFVDRWRKRQTMMVADGLRTVIALALFLLVRTGPAALPPLLLFVLCLELVGTFFRPAASALLPQLVPQDDLPAAAGLFQSSSASAQFVGLVGGGLLIGWVGVPLLFLLNGLTFVASVVGVGLVRVQEPLARRAKSASFLREWLEGMRAIGRSKALLRILAAALVANFALAPLDVLFPVWVRGTLHGPATDLGLLMGALLAGLVAGGLLVGSVAARLDLRAILAATFVLAGLALAALGALPSLPFDMAVGFALGVAAGVASGVLTALMLQKVPAEGRGRIFGALNALSTLATPAGIALAGILAGVPLPLLFAGFGAIAALAGASFFLPLRDDLAAMQA